MLCDIVTRYPTRPVICVGDFSTLGESAVLLPQCDRLTQRAMAMLEKCDVSVDGPTRGDNFLNLLFSKHVTVETNVPNGIFESDHAEISSTVRSVVCRAPYNLPMSIALNYKRADFDGMRRSLQLISWDAILSGDVNKAVDMFYGVLEGAIRDQITTVTLRRKYTPIPLVRLWG